MAKDRLSGTLAVILHADVAGSTALVQQDQQLAHERIQDSFRRFSNAIEKYQGHVLELRGDALLAEFKRASDAVSAALSFQIDHTNYINQITDDLRPAIRVGITMGEVTIADSTVTGAGVVQAQRVEQLADPGGVYITAAIQEALSKRMPFDLENLGEKELKGFEYPVRVYRVELRAGQSIPAPQQDSKNAKTQNKSRLIVTTILIALVVAGGAAYWFKTQGPKVEAASMDRMAFPLPDKPSIAVLPFVNMSDDAQQEYFVDGMTEDLITDLSKLSGLFVIARNSVFTYKGKSLKIRQVAEELGVRYVLEGSVRRVGDQVRINAQLIDTTTGGHLWAERYDGSMADVFALQDEVTKQIVDALSLNLSTEDAARSFHHKGVNIEAYDAFLQGWAHYRLQTPDGIAEAISAFDRAIVLDPGYAYAHAALAASYWEVWEKGWVQRLNMSFLRVSRQAKGHLQQAMKAPTPLAHWVASKISAAQGKYEDAVREAELAVALDSNNAIGHAALAFALILSGRPTEGADSIQQAMRLDPYYPPNYLVTLGQAQFGMERFEDVIVTLERAVQRTPDNESVWIYLAAAYGYLGKTEKGQVAVATFDELRLQRGLGELTSAYIDQGQFGQSLNRTRLNAGLANIPEPEWKSMIRRTAEGYEVRDATLADAAEAKALHEQGALFAYSTGWFGEFREGRIPGSIHFKPHQMSEVTLRQLIGEEQVVVFYNRGGYFLVSAAQATAKAINLGFKNVYYFQPGLNGWRSAGYRVEEGP